MEGDDRVLNVLNALLADELTAIAIDHQFMDQRHVGHRTRVVAGARLCDRDPNGRYAVRSPVRS